MSIRDSYIQIYHKNKGKIPFIFIVCIYLLRLICLDADPRYSILTFHYEIDEIAYHETAMKIANWGVQGFLEGITQVTSLSNARTYLLPNLIVSVFMKIFGNTFFGLRIGYVMMGLFMLILLNVFIKKHMESNLLRYIILLSFVCNYNFWGLSRSGMTTMGCSFFVTIMMVCILCLKGKKRYFLMGFFPIVLFVMVYMGLVFILPWSIFFFIFEMIFQKQERKDGKFYFVGILVSCIFCEVLDLIIYRSHFWNVVKDTFLAHNDKVSNTLIDIQLNGLFSVLSNYFRAFEFVYDVALLPVSFIMIVLLLYAIFVKKDRIAFALLSILAVHYAQTVFLSQLNESKTTITYVILLMAIAYALGNYYMYFYRKYSKHFLFYIVHALIFMLSYYTIHWSYAHTALVDIIPSDIRHVYYVLILLCCFVSLILLYINKTVWLVGPAIVSSCFGLFLCCYFSFTNVTYDMKDMLTDIGEQTEDGILLNGLCFSLYNKCTYPINIYDHYRGVGYDWDYVLHGFHDAVYDENPVYCIVTANQIGEWCISYMNENIYGDTPYYFEEIKTYEPRYADDPYFKEMYYMGLYKRVEKTW